MESQISFSKIYDIPKERFEGGCPWSRDLVGPQNDFSGQEVESTELKISCPSKSSILVLCKNKFGLISDWRHLVSSG